MHVELHEMLLLVFRRGIYTQSKLSREYLNERNLCKNVVVSLASRLFTNRICDHPGNRRRIDSYRDLKSVSWG